MFSLLEFGLIRPRIFPPPYPDQSKPIHKSPRRIPRPNYHLFHPDSPDFFVCFVFNVFLVAVGQHYFLYHKMSLDFSPGSTQAHGLYGHTELDQALNSLQNGESTSHHQLGASGLSSGGFDPNDGLDVPDHSSYDMFSNSPTTSFGTQHYRTNASSSSSLGPNYGMSGESVYSHSFGDSVHSFQGSNPYDVVHTSYGSEKITPLTPNDPMQPPPLFSMQSGMNNAGKDYSSQSGYPSLLPDRRTSNVSNTNNYGSDYPEDYSMDGINNAMNLNHSSHSAQQYQERLGHYQHDGRFSSGTSSAVPSHMPLHHNHGPEVLRGVAPQSTHSFRPDATGFGEMYPYMAPNLAGDLSLHMPGVDDTLARMKLQGQSGIGSSSDLQTFMRFVLHLMIQLFVLICPVSALFWINLLEPIIVLHLASAQ